MTRWLLLLGLVAGCATHALCIPIPRNCIPKRGITCNRYDQANCARNYFRYGVLPIPEDCVTDPDSPGIWCCPNPSEARP